LHLAHKAKLYEQGATVRRIGLYVKNWWRWVRAGVEISVVSLWISRQSPALAVGTVEKAKSRKD
jgi:hypothetical protein